MRILTILCVAAVTMIGCSPAAATEKVADLICPNTVPALQNYADLASVDDVSKTIDLVKAVIREYQTCTSTQRANGNTEPQSHYAQVRTAQFDVVLGRLYAKNGNPSQARSAFNDARGLAGSVAEWKTDGYGHSGGSRTSSRLHDAAQEIRDQAESELHAAASPAPVQSPSGERLR